MQKQLHAIHFFVATRNVCPLAIPESCAQNMGIRLVENHSLRAKFEGGRRGGQNVLFSTLLHCYRELLLSYLSLS